MHAKLHRVRVTDTHRDYMGSVTIDSELMARVGIMPLEEVQIVNVTNSNRVSTYPVPGEAGSGIICINGAAANLFTPGDIVLIFAFEQRDRAEVLLYGHEARVIIADEHNRCQEFLYQRLIPHQGFVEFYSSPSTTAPFNWVSSELKELPAHANGRDEPNQRIVEDV
jgi:aspartate 1-decarboxylase